MKKDYSIFIHILKKMEDFFFILCNINPNITILLVSLKTLKASGTIL